MTKFNISKIEYDGIKYIGKREQRLADLQEWLAWLREQRDWIARPQQFKPTLADIWSVMDVKIQELEKELK